MKRSSPGSWVLTAVVVSLAAMSPRGSLEAQQRVTVSGRVVSASTSAPIEGATVELNSRRQVLTTSDGQFVFADVIPGPVHLYIEMLGYVPLNLELSVGRDTAVVVRLEEAPIRIEGIDVDARTISVRGRATDPRTNLGVAGTVYGHPGGRETSTNMTGRYRLSDLPATDSTFVTMYAYGYQAQQQQVETDGDAVVDFVMMPDSVVVRIVQHMTGRLAARSDATGRTVTRGTYEEFNHAGTILDVLRYQYHVQSYECLVWDDDPDRRSWVVPMPHEVELIEIIGQRGTAADMVRIYTKDYFSRKIGSPAELNEIFIRGRGSSARCR